MKKLWIILIAVAVSMNFASAQKSENELLNKIREERGYGRDFDVYRAYISDLEELNPQTPEGIYYVGMGHYFDDDNLEALKFFEKAYELGKRDRELYESISRVATYSSDKKAYNGSLKLLERIIKENPADADAQLIYAKLLYDTDPKKGEKVMREVSDRFPADPGLHEEMAIVYGFKEDPVKSLEEIDKAVALAPDSVDFIAMRASIKLEINRDDPSWIEDVIAIWDKDFDYSFSALYSLSQENRQAMFEMLKAKAETDPRFLKKLALFQREYQLSQEETIPVLKEMVEKGVADEEDYVRLTEELAENGHYAESVDIINKAISIFPDSPMLKRAKSVLYFYVGKNEEALAMIKDCLKDFPKNVDLFEMEAEALLNLGRYAEALEPAEKAVMFNPGHHNVAIYAEALALTGNKEKAKDLFETILKIVDPLNEEEIFLTDVLAAARAAIGLGDNELAVKIIETHEPTVSIVVETTPEEIEPYAVEVAEVPEETEDSTEYNYYNLYKAIVYAMAGEKEKGLDAMKKYAENSKVYPIYLSTYMLQNLQSEPEFIEIFESQGTKARRNPATGLLEAVLN